MDSSGEQHLQMDHNIYKTRLDLSGKVLEEPKKQEIILSTTVFIMLTKDLIELKLVLKTT